MAVYSFPRMDGQPSRMTTEQLCEDAYERGFLEGSFGFLNRFSVRGWDILASGRRGHDDAGPK